LPQQSTAAQIVLTDKNGKVIKQLAIAGSGKGSLHIDVATLLA
jgi:hypothetical protein